MRVWVRFKRDTKGAVQSLDGVYFQETVVTESPVFIFSVFDNIQNDRADFNKLTPLQDFAGFVKANATQAPLDGEPRDLLTEKLDSGKS